MRLITENIGTILVGAVLLGVVIAIVRGLTRDKKQGKCSCGGNCGTCGHCK